MLEQDAENNGTASPHLSASLYSKKLHVVKLRRAGQSSEAEITSEAVVSLGIAIKSRTYVPYSKHTIRIH